MTSTETTLEMLEEHTTDEWDETVLAARFAAATSGLADILAELGIGDEPQGA